MTQHLIITSTLSISERNLGDILVWNSKENQFRRIYNEDLKIDNDFYKILEKNNINDNTKYTATDKYHHITGSGTLGIKDNYESLHSDIKNRHPITTEIFADVKDFGMNYGDKSETSSLTYEDEMLLQYLNELHKTKKFSKMKTYAVIISLTNGENNTSVHSGHAYTPIQLDDSALEIGNDIKIKHKTYDSNKLMGYDGPFCKAGPSPSKSLIAFKIKKFSVGFFTNKVKFIY
jgi:hypothetical protein